MSAKNVPPMGLLPTAELTALRAAAAASCDTPATIQRATTATDGYGYTTDTWADVTPVGGLLVRLARPTAGTQQLYAARIGALASWVIRLPYGTPVRQNDRISASGQTMTVQVDLSVSSYSTCVSVLATEVREA